MTTCGAIVVGRRRLAKDRGKVCGRTVVAFVAPGVGRCGLHDTVLERTRARALLEAVRDVRELRGCPREPGDEQHEGDEAFYGEERTNPGPEFDPVGFMDPALDE